MVSEFEKGQHYQFKRDVHVLEMKTVQRYNYK